MLGVEQKTLRKWVRSTDIKTVRDEADTRRRLLNDQQIEQLRNRYRRPSQTQNDVVSLLRSLEEKIDREFALIRQQLQMRS